MLVHMLDREHELCQDDEADLLTEASLVAGGPQGVELCEEIATADVLTRQKHTCGVLSSSNPWRRQLNGRIQAVDRLETVPQRRYGRSV